MSLRNQISIQAKSLTEFLSNSTTPPFPGIGNETRTGGFPTGTSAPFPAGNTSVPFPTGTLITGTAPISTPVTSNPYFQPNATLTFNGTFTTTYTTVITTTAVQVFNTTIVTAYPSAYVSVVQYGSASTTTIIGPTIVSFEFVPRYSRT